MPKREGGPGAQRAYHGPMHPDDAAPQTGPWSEDDSPPTPRRREADAAPAMRPDDAPVVRRGLIPPALLDPDAVFVVKRLQKSGHEAYLVGGCVRDLLAGHEPKDFDVATDAHPPRIRKLFHSAHIIGRRFRLVHVRFPGNHVIETSTFRADPERFTREAQAAGESVEAWLDHIGNENLFGSAPEDARRRDFTINALFYDPVHEEVVDWVGGLEDLERRIVRSIGDPTRRLVEDPVRMIRAVHFAQRLEFALEPGLEVAIREQAERIADASGARLYIELLKIVMRGRSRPTLHRLWELGVLGAWIPEWTRDLDRPMAWPSASGGTHLEASRGEPADAPTAHATWNLLGAADRWGLAARGAPESLALAAAFGPWLLEGWRASGGGDSYPAFAQTLEDLFRPVALRMSVPRWAASRMRDVLWMLLELRHPPGPRPRRRLFFRHGFSEALALLEMDLRARDCDDALLEEWLAAAEEAGAHLDLASTDQARAEAQQDFPPPDRHRRGRRGGRARGEPAGEARHGGGIAAEADAWEPPPDEDAPVGAAPATRASPPPAPPEPRQALPPVAPPRPPVARTPEVPRTSAPPVPPAPPAAPPPLLADDDFSAGL